VAARGGRAAERADATHRRADGLAGERSGSPIRARSVRPRASEIGLVRRPQFADQYSLGEPRRSGVDASIREGTRRVTADLILSHSTPATAALLQETRTIPVVFGIVADPIGSGFVASFPRPGGNATGFAVAEPTQASKWMELLKEIAPQVTRVATLFNPAMASFLEFWLKPFKAAAPSFGVEVIEAPVHDTSELESVMAVQAREANSGLFAPDGNLHRCVAAYE
jgi:ABC-type uncharacterized transport system substrate-binding protein